LIASLLLWFGLDSIIQRYRWLTSLWRKREFGTYKHAQMRTTNMRAISFIKIIIFKLIQRFYELDGGDLTIQNEKLKNINLAWLRSQIGIVSQVIALDYSMILIWTWAIRAIRAQNHNQFFVFLKIRYLLSERIQKLKSQTLADMWLIWKLAKIKILLHTDSLNFLCVLKLNLGASVVW